MKIAVLSRRKEPFSLRIYLENILKELKALGVEILPFTEDDTIPAQCDLLWEPGLAGSRAPHPIFKNILKPLVATVHGAGPFSLKWKEIYPSLLAALRGQLDKQRALAAWSWFRKKVSAVIAVSEFGAQEVSRVFNFPRDIVYSIYHGVDHETFCFEGEKLNINRSYMLHISQYKRKKNVSRIFAAYINLPEHGRPDLITILPSYRGKRVDIRGLKLISKGLPSIELAKWYRSALGFVFPSLHETFGMPILEAMACGCPVVTSNVSACSEIAGEAALLVNPRSVEDITNAIQRLVRDESLRYSLRQKGLARAQQFTWGKSAERHLKVFEGILSGKRQHYI